MTVPLSCSYTFFVVPSVHPLAFLMLFVLVSDILEACSCGPYGASLWVGPAPKASSFF